MSEQYATIECETWNIKITVYNETDYDRWVASHIKRFPECGNDGDLSNEKHDVK